MIQLAIYAFAISNTQLQSDHIFSVVFVFKEVRRSVKNDCVYQRVVNSITELSACVQWLSSSCVAAAVCIVLADFAVVHH